MKTSAENNTALIAAGAGVALIAAGALQGAAITQATATEASQTVPTIETGAESTYTTAATRLVQQPKVVGEFSFTQTEVSSNEWLMKHIAGASKGSVANVGVELGSRG